MHLSPSALRRLPAVAVLVALVPLATACGDEPIAPPEMVSAGDEPFDVAQAVVGEQVALTAEVQQVLTPTSFRIGGDDVAGEEELLLISKNVGDRQPGDVVQVMGIVRLFDYEEYVEEYQLGPADSYRGDDGDLIVVARTVDTNVPGDGP